MSINILKTYKGQSTTLNPNTFEREGYDFEGWNTERDGSGISYLDGLTVEEGFEVNPTNLYAQWSSYTFVAASHAASTSLIYSDDYCKTWNTATYPSIDAGGRINLILNYDNQFYCFYQNTLLRSSNGKTWTGIPFSPTHYINSFVSYKNPDGEQIYMMCTDGDDNSSVWTYITKSLYDNTWTLYTLLIKTARHITNMINVNGSIYALRRVDGSNDGAIMKFNTTNHQWDVINLTDLQLDCLYYGNDNIVAVGTHNACYSTNGTTWLSSDIPSSSGITSYSARMISHNGKFYVLRKTTNIADTCMCSEDLSSWTSQIIPATFFSSGVDSVKNIPVTSSKNCLAYTLINTSTNEKVAYTLDNGETWNTSQIVPNNLAQFYCIASGKTSSQESGLFILNSYLDILNQNELFEILEVGTSLSTFNTAWKSPSQATTIDVNNTSAMYNELLNDDYFDDSEYITGSKPERTAFKLKLKALKDMSISIGNRNNYYSYLIVKNTDSPNFTCILSRYNTYSEDDKNKNAPYRHRTCLYCDNININVSSNGYDFSLTISKDTVITLYFYETYDRKQGDTHPAEDMNIYTKNIDYSLNRLLLAVKI